MKTQTDVLYSFSSRNTYLTFIFRISNRELERTSESSIPVFSVSRLGNEVPIGNFDIWDYTLTSDLGPFAPNWYLFRAPLANSQMFRPMPGTVSLRFICVVAHVNSLFMLKSISLYWMYTFCLLIHQLMDIWIVSSFLSTLNNAAMNICLNVFGQVFSFLWVDA